MSSNKKPRKKTSKKPEWVKPELDLITSDFRWSVCQDCTTGSNAGADCGHGNTPITWSCFGGSFAGK
ncbi:hypothetical protein ACFLUV_05860 [Elusimicrobiota bacterium]